MRVTLVVGMHRSARRHTVDALLAESDGSVVVHHDMSEIGEGTVRRLTRDGTGAVDEHEVDLVHACASCTVREDLIPFLLRTADEGAHDLCVVEAWDGVEPRLIAESIADEEALHLTAVIAAVRSEDLLDDLYCHDLLDDRELDIAQDDERSVTEVLSRQVEYASAITVHGADAEHGTDGIRALLEQLNPAAAVIGAGTGLAGFTRGAFDTEAAHARSNPAWAWYGDRADGRVRTVTWTRTRPLHPERFADALERVVSLGSRGRGRFWLAGRPDDLLVWESYGDLLMVEHGGPWLAALPEAALELVPEARRVRARLDWNPEIGDRRQHLAFTGVDMEVDELIGLLDSCLVTDEESGQEFLTDPFAEFSER
ncbi:GTP-binding protein [Nocardiopsis sp. N85]|uniref:CobW family GTP-binding protein n=1 Tax=Nocardiopsis sp. N85 TaxID=3029400 RepID=UPI00237F1EDE|nr:GTP-binding protein [Nocardiopsis sp. N85]MDE3722937.1 GTP-binding protein [Nocardiopsis sp. N85]